MHFEDTVATVGEDLQVLVRLEGPVQAVGAVLVEVRTSTQADWLLSIGQPVDPYTWIATIKAEKLQNVRVDDLLEVRAQVKGRRGGLLGRLGYADPLLVPVLTRLESEKRKEQLRILEPDQGPLLAWLSLEAAAGSAARARIFVGGLLRIDDQLQVGFRVGTGPNFLEPPHREESGPLTVCLESSLRLIRQPPPGFPRFIASLFVRTDLRLPGVDASAGLRGGLQTFLSSDLGLEATLGGGPVWVDIGNQDVLSIQGGLNLALTIGN